MSGRKATALPILTTPADDDILYIIDVSDTSESAQGTSKQIVKSDLIPAAVEISQGEWTPTITTTSTGASNYKSTYIAFSQYVDVMCYISIDNPSLIENISFTISPPVGFDLDDSEDLNCLGTINLVQASYTTFINSILVKGNSGNIGCELSSVDPPTSYDLVVVARYKRLIP